MARYEGDLREQAEAPLGGDELLALARAVADEEAATRGNAIACYLSGGDGWREAVKRLGGAFADQGSGLSGRKGD